MSRRVLSIGLIAAGILSAAARTNAGVGEPELFGEGVISTPDDEDSITLTPDGQTAFFVKRSPGTIGSPLPVIMETHRTARSWSEPAVAPFSGRYRDGYPFVSPDGRRVFFSSLRPVEGAPKRGYDIWVVERGSSGWSEPKNLGEPVNGDGYEVSPSVSRSGTLYFTNLRPGSDSTFNIFRSRLADGKYERPELLRGKIAEHKGFVTSVCVAPDESLLVFSSAGAPDEIVGVHQRYDAGDLYVSFRDGDAWTAARNLGKPINSGAREGSPRISADGKYLFFTSERGFATYRPAKAWTYSDLQTQFHTVLNGLGNIYREPLAPILEILRSKAN